jgi:hypothetical protein
VAVIGLIKQVHSYEPDLRRPKADVEEGVGMVLFK